MASFDPESDVDIEDIFGNSDKSEDEFMGFNEAEIDSMRRAREENILSKIYLREKTWSIQWKFGWNSMEYWRKWSHNTRIPWESWTKTQTSTPCDAARLSETVFHCWTASNGCGQQKHLCSGKLAGNSLASGNVEADKLWRNLCILGCDYSPLFWWAS